MYLITHRFPPADLSIYAYFRNVLTPFDPLTFIVYEPFSKGHPIGGHVFHSCKMKTQKHNIFMELFLSKSRDVREIVSDSISDLVNSLGDKSWIFLQIRVIFGR